MAFTSHGHYIPESGTDEAGEPVAIIRCGGMNLCAVCIGDATAWRIKNKNPFGKIRKGYELVYTIEELKNLIAGAERLGFHNDVIFFQNKLNEMQNKNGVML